MFRLGKLTDYGIVVLAQLARDTGDETSGVHNARELAAEADLPAPAVSKILKALARHGVLDSQRGSRGGYALARPPEQITVAEMLEALEGPVALTECAVGAQICQHEAACAVRDPWRVINGVVQDALKQITLADLVDPKFSAQASPLRILTSPPTPSSAVTSQFERLE